MRGAFFPFNPQCQHTFFIQVEEMVSAINDELKDEEIPLRVANLLCSGNYALSGSVGAIEAVEARAKPDFNARMTVRLAVAGAFHSPFMSPAAEALREALNNTKFTKPRIPVLSNVDAQVVRIQLSLRLNVQGIFN